MLGMSGLARRIFGSANERVLARYRGRVQAINDLEGEVRGLSDSGIRERFSAARSRAGGGERLERLLPEVFALTREASRRVLGQRPFDVQLIGGMVLHEGKIAEMKTGEGKTLAATLPACLNALSGRGVHIVTVNDYLARRDAEWMGRIYGFLGLETGCILHEMDDAARGAAYRADITYGTNNELGFDYLRDNMKYRLEDMVQRGHGFGIVDEVDSILIDEARTPLIISGPVEDRSEMYTAIDAVIPQLVAEDFELEEKTRSVSLTEVGQEHVERLLAERDLLGGGGLYDIENVSAVHHVNQALRAHKLFLRDRDYIVKGGRVVIIDEFTGRMMEGRRYSEGLHQALEAKEKAQIQPENQTLASITFQNYFRLYEKLSGMTGTAMTEAEEFAAIYGLESVAIDTNLPVRRGDMDDEVYLTAGEKYEAIVEAIAECRKAGQPVLVGTTSIEKSEHLSGLLKRRQIAHSVLNARYHEQEAQIIAQAGAPGAVTIATNMAGRGTDIQLGGNLEMQLAQDEAEGAAAERIRGEIGEKKRRVIAAGGLFVLGTERHESRRIDNQLRGRSGRQGDPGASKFFLSLEDDLMRIFGSERMGGMLQKLGLKEGEAIVHPWINKALEKAQARVEARNFDIRKNLLKFDDVMNDQRKIVFEQRLDLIREEESEEMTADMRAQVIGEMVAAHIPERAYPEQWDSAGLARAAREGLGLELPVEGWAREEGIADEEIRQRLERAAAERWAQTAGQAGPEAARQIEKAVLLQTLDGHWREHLSRLEHLRQVVGLRGYGQRDPLNEYKTEAFTLFEALLSQLRSDVTRRLLNLRIEREAIPAPALEVPEMEARHETPAGGMAAIAPPGPAAAGRRPGAGRQRGAGGANGAGRAVPASSAKVARNAPCPCGSGKKYKHCHGRSA